MAFVIGSYADFRQDNVRILLAVEHKLLEPADLEIAYALSKDYRGLGHATEAVRGMASYMFDLSSLIEITAIVKPFNIASRRVLEKAGFLPLRRLRLADGADYDYFKLTRGAASFRPVSGKPIF